MKNILFLLGLGTIILISYPQESMARQKRMSATKRGYDIEFNSKAECMNGAIILDRLAKTEKDIIIKTNCLKDDGYWWLENFWQVRYTKSPDQVFYLELGGIKECREVNRFLKEISDEGNVSLDVDCKKTGFVFTFPFKNPDYFILGTVKIQ